MNRTELQNLIGPIALQLTDKQILELAPIAQANPTGLAQTVATIELDPNIQSPVGALLGRVRRGDIRQKQNTKRPTTDPLERAHALYAGKLRDLTSTPWNEAERIEFAIDYALDHCGAYGQTLLDTETQLRHELHAPRWDPNTDAPLIPNDPATNTPHRAAMKDAHGSTWSPDDMKPERMA